MRYRITPEAVDAFRAGDDHALREALGIRPWEWPTLADDDEPCTCPPGTAGAEWWPKARELRKALEAAASQNSRPSGR